MFYIDDNKDIVSSMISVFVVGVVSVVFIKSATQNIQGSIRDWSV